MKIDWTTINKKLPYTNSESDQKLRAQIFKTMDPNGNGHVSLAEIDKGINDMGPSMKPIYENKDVMLRAFQAAKGRNKSSGGTEGDFVQRSEFRFLMMYLR